MLVYNENNWIKKLWEITTKNNSQSNEVQHELTAKNKTASTLAEDIYSRLYLPNEPTKKENTPQWAEQIVDGLNNLPEFKKLHRDCAGNSALASRATTNLLHSLLDLVPAKEESQDKPKIPFIPGQDLEESNDETENLRQYLRLAVNANKKQHEENKELIDGVIQTFGQGNELDNGQGSLLQIEAIEKAINLASRSPNLKNILQYVGRLLRATKTTKRNSVEQAVSQIKGLTLSNNLAFVVPSELTNLSSSNAVLRTMVIKKIMDRQALSYKLEGKQAKEKGPIVCCIDESGSMHGDKNNWAKAVALALFTQAKQEKRNFSLIRFNGSIRNIKTYEAKDKQSTLAYISDFMHEPQGGTDFNGPLSKAMDIISQDKKFKNADILMITDGEGSIDEQVKVRLNEQSKKSGLNLYVIGIGYTRSLKSTFVGITNEVYNINENAINDNVNPELCDIFNKISDHRE